jgi:predicted membrane chloride channel (bestrophin family)
MQLPASFLSGTVGTVLGFSIALLTSSGKDQYNEGRRLWCTMLTVATDLSQNVRCGCSLSPSTTSLTNT